MKHLLVSLISSSSILGQTTDSTENPTARGQQARERQKCQILNRDSFDEHQPKFFLIKKSYWDFI
jgi:hypothetical protein